MSERNGTDPIADDEILYRRIPASQGWYDPDRKQPLAAEAFKPRRDDTDGISLWRATYKSVAEAAAGASRHGYYVASIRAGDLRELGTQPVATPQEMGPGHVSIPVLNYADRHTNRVLEVSRRIATHLCQRVDGPFHAAKEGET